MLPLDRNEWTNKERNKPDRLSLRKTRDEHSHGISPPLRLDALCFPTVAFVLAQAVHPALPKKRDLRTCFSLFKCRPRRKEIWLRTKCSAVEIYCYGLVGARGAPGWPSASARCPMSQFMAEKKREHVKNIVQTLRKWRGQDKRVLWGRFIWSLWKESLLGTGKGPFFP